MTNKMTPESINCPTELAAQLAAIHRFAGRSVQFDTPSGLVAPGYFNVADHSVYVMRLTATLTDDIPILMAALLHDLHEAFTGDLTRNFYDGFTQSSRCNIDVARLRMQDRFTFITDWWKAAKKINPENGWGLVNQVDDLVNHIEHIIITEGMDAVDVDALPTSRHIHCPADCVNAIGLPIPRPTGHREIMAAAYTFHTAFNDLVYRFDQSKQGASK